MKKHIQQLAAIANKPVRHIIGLMSGTSLDGLDIALCAFEGSGIHTRVKLLKFQTINYDDRFRSEIRRVFAKKEIDFQHLVLLNVLVAERHAALVNQCLAGWGLSSGDIDLLASHGQTVFHAPRIFHGMPEYPNATLQIGDGDFLALRTGVITLSDFRQKHVAAGGEGAPLALYGDYFLFSQKGENRCLLNIGGIANFTWLPGDGNANESFATDTGPGNTLIDAFAQEYFGQPFDKDAQFARKGQINKSLLDKLREDPFFAKPFPKTIGPELFSVNWVKAAIQRTGLNDLSTFDIMATLTRLTADTIAEALTRACPQTTGTPAPVLYLSGGGAHNPLIVKYLSDKLPGWKMLPMQDLGVDGDAKEAVLFAALANETVAGEPLPNDSLGGLPLIGMGKISFPA
ncbi:MAG: anhydro-N-acetylmuramic acid kinase [Lewinellaceae bacterium]|nr:anhydro-N-acetylmuramic acid kinase [Lewinellaceae bacterium]